MRYDSLGLFWKDEEQEKGRGAVVRAMPEIPGRPFERLGVLPNLERAKVISLDVETYDPKLDELGPGWARGDGHICGVSIGADEDGRWYFPIRHTIQPDENYDSARVFGWLREVLGRPDQPKVGTNLVYDLGWLRQEGIAVRGDLFDVQFAEALLDEAAHVALEILANKYLGTGKVGGVLYQWCSDYYGGRADGSQRKNIYRSPPRLAAPYAMGDVDLPLRILKKQWPLLYQHGLLNLFEMECALLPLLVEMRFAGVSVDIAQAERVRANLLERELALKKTLNTLCGFEVNINASESIAKAFNKFNLPYALTEKARKPSFTKEFLRAVTHPVGKAIIEIRNVSKTRGTFVESYILEAHKSGKVYPEFHPLKGDDGGTRTGRFSSSNPNYQNLPAKDEEMGRLVRSIMVPDNGHKQWREYDYNQLQYRFLAHYAVGDGAENLRHIFRTDPTADYHATVQRLIFEVTAIKLERKPTKNVNFGFVFGMGLAHLCEMLGLSLSEGKKLLTSYHAGVPYVKKTLEYFSEQANTFGTIRTILGRVSHFDLWEPSNWRDKRPALPHDNALVEYGSIKRAYTYKALNYLLQGGEGDLMKTAMLRCWRDGVYSRIGVPRLTVHDSLSHSDAGNANEDAWDHMQHIMETAIPLSIPITVGFKVGDSWGACL
jgi:DNA polymerase I-like protein with 3'-5' exonuclease and polymerase domains